MVNGLGNLNGVPVQYSYQDALNQWTPEQWQQFGSAGGTYQNLSGLNSTQPGFLDKTMNFLGSDTMKGLGTIGSLGLGAFNIINTRNAQKQAKQMWEAENARANELMAMNKEKYETYKADKARLNSQYV